MFHIPNNSQYINSKNVVNHYYKDMLEHGEIKLKVFASEAASNPTLI